ncbi:hypothetical protein [Niallia sp. FSL W8-0635]|nr:Uncharacterised protein [Mycobacteroides abscessus subsp. abscessus]HEO8418480.1 hypothetical protein [Yersinia enterocolitica]
MKKVPIFLAVGVFLFMSGIYFPRNGLSSEQRFPLLEDTWWEEAHTS